MNALVVMNGNHNSSCFNLYEVRNGQIYNKYHLSKFMPLLTEKMTEFNWFGNMRTDCFRAKRQYMHGVTAAIRI